GPIDTPMLRASTGHGELAAREAARTAGRVLLGGPGRPEDVAGVIAFLLGPDAGFLTRAVVACAGGGHPRSRAPAGGGRGRGARPAGAGEVSGARWAAMATASVAAASGGVQTTADGSCSLTAARKRRIDRSSGGDAERRETCCPRLTPVRVKSGSRSSLSVASDAMTSRP